MEKERSIDRLARYIIAAGTIAILAWLCWYFKNVLVYIIAAFVVSLIGQPVMKRLRKITVKGKAAPDWLLAILTILVILGALLLVVTQAIPVVTRIVREAAILNSATSVGNPLDRVNYWIIGLFPGLGPNFDIIDILMDKLKEVTNLSNVTAVISSVTSFVTSFAVGLFSIVSLPSSSCGTASCSARSSARWFRTGWKRRSGKPSLTSKASSPGISWVW